MMQASSHLHDPEQLRSEPTSSAVKGERWPPAMTITFVVATSTTLWAVIIATASWLIG